MTEEAGKKLVKLIVICMILQLGVVGYVFYQSYQGRVDTVTAQRKGCERSKLDRGDNALGWRTAQTARMSSVAETENIPVEEVEKVLLKAEPQLSDSYDLRAARDYNQIAMALEKRSNIVCADAFPKASLIP